MKNKIIIYLVFFISICEISSAEKYIFEVNKINLSNNGNLISAYDGKAISKSNDLTITAEKFKYTKDLDILEAYNGTALLKNKNLRIKFIKLKVNNKDFTFELTEGIIINDLKNLLNIESETILIDRKNNILTATDGVKVDDLKNLLNIESETILIDRKNNILTATDGVKVDDLKNLLNIESEKIVLDRKNNILTATDGVKVDDLENSLNIETKTIVLDKKNNILNSSTSTILKDKSDNIITTNEFKYELDKKKLIISKAKIKDINDNTFEIDSAYVDANKNKLIGKDVFLELNNSSFKENNDPRIAGKSIKHDKNITEVSKGIFTLCKKNDKCPPWQLMAEKITHNKKKKNISYKNVWLKIYDVPVVYFPKFFHPDPTVKRQSGLLMPTFKNSPNNETFLSIPYYKVLSENRDITISPRFYAKDQLMIQNEYREVNRSNKTNADFSFLTKKGGIESHLFYNYASKLNINRFDDNIFKLKIEKTSNDTYLKANKIKSPIINNYEVLETSLGLNMISSDLNINTNFIMYENLNEISRDRYEYIFPSIDLSKNLKNNTNLKGDFKLNSTNYIHNYQTNIIEKVNINDFIFNSTPKITKLGLKNNFDFIIRNSNTDADNSKTTKNKEDLYLSGLYQFNSTYPLFKKTENFRNLLTPKISLKLSPIHTKDLSKDEYKLDVNNIYNLNRLSSRQTLEGGMSLTYGTDYSINNEKDDREVLGIKIANNLRLKENDDLERNHQLGAKISNFFGEIKYSPNNYLTTKYNFAAKNNFNDINYENLIAEIKVNNFVTTFNYVNENNLDDKNSYLLNTTSYNFDESNNISFSTRSNKNTDLTEYYNLMYQYKNDCLAASIEYQKEYYNDREIKPSESVFLKLSIIPFGTTGTPNLKK